MFKLRLGLGFKNLVFGFCGRSISHRIQDYFSSKAHVFSFFRKRVIEKPRRLRPFCLVFPARQSRRQKFQIILFVFVANCVMCLHLW